MGLKSRQLAVLIDGVHTDIILTVYSDCVLVVCTQRAKLGHLFEAYSDGGDGDCETFTVNPLLGSREGIELIFARQIVEALSKSTKRKLFISLSLQERTPPLSTLHGLLAVLRANVIWKR
jgi:hypothetical protein